MNLEEFHKEQCTIDMMKANLVGIKYMLLFAFVFGLPYYLIWGLHSKPLFISDHLFLKAIFPVLLFLLGIVFHELVHGFFFARYAQKGFKSVKFGIMWKYLAPYAHCKEPLKIKHYIVALLAPLFFVGIIPGIIGIILGNFMLTTFGIVLSACAAGDLMIYSLIKKENPEDYVQDHPTEAGYFIFRKKD